MWQAEVRVDLDAIRENVSRLRSGTSAELMAVVKGDGDLVWASAVRDCAAGLPQRVYDGGRVSGGDDEARPALHQPVGGEQAELATTRPMTTDLALALPW